MMLTETFKAGVGLKNKNGRRYFSSSFLLSLGIHIALISIFATYVIIKGLERTDHTFIPTPISPIQKIDPRKLEYKVRMSQSQMKSGRPIVSPRLTACAVGSIALPEIKTQIKPSPNRDWSPLTSFSISGTGDGFGGGHGTGGLGLGLPPVNFFGIPDRAERIVFIVDASKSMLEDERGGVNGYEAVKKELARMINNLSETSFFNVIVYEKGVDAFQPKMVLANAEMKSKAEKWISPYNTDIKNMVFGTTHNNYTPQNTIPGGKAGTTRMDLGLTAAFEMGAEAVFIITDGTPRINRPLTPQEQKEKDEYQKLLDAPDSPERKRIEAAYKKWEADRKKLNDERAKKGLPPKIQEQENKGGHGHNPKFNNETILQFLDEMVKKNYEDKKKKGPRVHVVGYMTDQGTEAFLRSLATQNKGQFRRIKSLVKPINGSARM